MAVTPRVVCLIVAIVLFAVASVWMPPARFNIIAAGLAFMALALLLP